MVHATCSPQLAGELPRKPVKRARIIYRAKGYLGGSGVGFLVLPLRLCVSISVGQPDPDAIAYANPYPPTPADRLVPLHGWRLVIVLCACRARAGAHLPLLNQESDITKLRTKDSFARMVICTESNIYQTYNVSFSESGLTRWFLPPAWGLHYASPRRTPPATHPLPFVHEHHHHCITITASPSLHHHHYTNPTALVSPPPPSASPSSSPSAARGHADIPRRR